MSCTLPSSSVSLSDYHPNQRPLSSWNPQKAPFPFPTSECLLVPCTNVPWPRRSGSAHRVRPALCLSVHHCATWNENSHHHSKPQTSTEWFLQQSIETTASLSNSLKFFGDVKVCTVCTFQVTWNHREGLWCWETSHFNNDICLFFKGQSQIKH